MPTKKGKLPAQGNDALSYRYLVPRETPADGPIPVVLATEAPVRVYDETRRQIVDEILLMSGAELPRQVALVNSHNRFSAREIYGSIRGLQVVGSELHGMTHFASDGESQRARSLVADGHITDASVGAERLAVKYLERGETWTHQGKQYKGPARIVTRWRPVEGSVVAVGADPSAKFSPAYRAYVDPEGLRREAMNEEFRNWLVERGMPKDHSDEEALKWASENLSTRQLSEAPVENVTERAKAVSGVAVTPAVDVEKLAADIAERARQIEAERIAKRTAEEEKIRSLVQRAGLENSFGDTLCRSHVSLADAADKILEEQEKQRRGSFSITPTGSRHESFRAAVMDGVTMRMHSAANKPLSSDFKPAEGASEFRGMRLLDMMRRCLEWEGVSTRGMTDMDIAKRAFSMPITTRASDGQAYLTSGNFANLLLDASNKTLLKAYNETPATWGRWVRKAESVADFKDINRMRLGEIGNQPMIEENGDYKDMSLSDQKERYRVHKHGSLLSFTWEAMRNDDLNAFMRAQQLQTAAMARTVDKSCYQVLFDNPTLSDGGALFNNTATSSAGGHDNLVATDISVTNLDAAFTKFMLRPGLNSDVTLGITPRFLLVAPGIASTAWQFVNSTADPAVGGNAAGNSNTRNNYGPGGSRQLDVIEVHWLHANDDDSWYLVADSNLVDTLEITFLQGEETPVFEQETAFVQDAVKYKIRQTWGVAAIDWRGLLKSAGG